MADNGLHTDSRFLQLQQMIQLKFPSDITSRNQDRDLVFMHQETTLCSVHFADRIKVYGVSTGWTKQTTYICFPDSDGTWFYFIETLDECIGELEQLIRFELKQCYTAVSHLPSFQEQVAKFDLENPDVWKSDVRPRIIGMLKPLSERTDYLLSLAEKSNRYIDCKLSDARSSEFRIRKAEKDDVLVVFNHHSTYMLLTRHLSLAPNSRPSKSADHIYMDIRTLWNVFCVLANTKDLIV